MAKAEDEKALKAVEKAQDLLASVNWLDATLRCNEIHAELDKITSGLKAVVSILARRTGRSS